MQNKALCYLLLFSLIVRLILANFSHVITDPHLNVVKFIAENLAFPRLEPVFHPLFWSPPMFHLIHAFFYKLGLVFSREIGRIIVVSLQPIIGTISLYVSYLIFKKISNKRLAFLGTCFLSFFPPHIVFSYYPLVDMTLFLFLTLAAYFFLERKYHLGGIFFALGLLTKHNGTFFFVPLVILIWVNEKKVSICLKKLYLLIGYSIVGSIWYFRNWIVLENPVYHFLGNIFGGVYLRYPLGFVDNRGTFFEILWDIFSTIFYTQERIFADPIKLFGYGYTAFCFFILLLIVWGLFILIKDYIQKKGMLKERNYFLFLISIVLFFSIFYFLYVSDYKSPGVGGGRLLLPLHLVTAFCFGYALNKIKIKRVVLIILIISFGIFYSTQIGGRVLVEMQNFEYKEEAKLLDQHMEVSENIVFMDSTNFLKWDVERDILSWGSWKNQWMDFQQYIKDNVNLCHYGYIYSYTLNQSEIHKRYQGAGFNITTKTSFTNPKLDSQLWKVESCRRILPQHI